MAHVSKIVHVKILNSMGLPVDFENLRLPARLKERYIEIQNAKEEIGAQPSLDESEEFEQKLNSEEFILALKMRKVFGFLASLSASN